MALLLNANALHIPIADNSVQMCVTSPPYWALRSYLDADSPNKQYELGSERVPDCLGWATGAPCGSCYVCDMVAVFREVKRILRDDGVLFLNLGDSYANSNPGSGGKCKLPGAGKNMTESRYTNIKRDVSTLKPKDLCMIPARVALALQADGWWLRSDIIWAKPNPMPESVTDRPTKSFEHVFLLAKSESYIWDQEAVREGFADARNGNPGAYKWSYANDSETGKVVRGAGGPNTKLQSEGWNADGVKTGHNMRDVWQISTQPTKAAHFATMPEALVDRCIRAGTSEGGCCPTCGQAWERVIEKQKPPKEAYAKNGKPEDIAAVSHPELGKVAMGQKLQNWYEEHPTKQLGFRQSCACPPQPPIGCLVFDPFTGSGTSGRVAMKLNRRFVGTELSLKYLLEIAKKRTSEIQPKMIGF